MTPSARLSASIDILADIEARHRPAADALKDWGLSHRFAGSGDRAALAGLVYDALRRKASAAFLMGDARARIFCSRNEAELLAIDGYYQTAESMDASLRGRAVQVWLEGAGLSVEALD